ncbi:MAG: hypothetical protein ACTS2F_29165 [Thainema sp.]
MGFADLSIAEIAEDHHCSVAAVCEICDKLAITYRDAETRLALEDAKAVIQALMVRQRSQDPGNP